MRGWANAYIEKLKKGETVQFRPRGSSMAPKIKSGQLVTVEPPKWEIEIGDIVLCQVNGKQWLHKVTAGSHDGARFQISNNKGHINGWTSWKNIYGVVTCVED
jgi:phage repressor protein C with HTH and peptisase S24 domain